MARFMARRKAIRFSIWSAILCASSWASSSGSLTSLMLSLTGRLPHSFSSPAAEPVGLDALAPDDHAGACGVDVDDDRSRVRSISIRDRAPLVKLASQIVADLPVLVDKFDVVLVAEPARLPVSGRHRAGRHRGVSSVPSAALLVHAGDHDGDVAGPLADPGRSGPGPGAGTALQGRSLVGERLGDHQVVGIERVVVLGVGHRRVQHLAARSPPGGAG